MSQQRGATHSFLLELMLFPRTAPGDLAQVELIKAAATLHLTNSKSLRCLSVGASWEMQFLRATSFG